MDVKDISKMKVGEWTKLEGDFGKLLGGKGKLVMVTFTLENNDTVETFKVKANGFNEDDYDIEI